MCYRKQTGSKVYDMYEARAIREDLELETVVGNITSTVIQAGDRPMDGPSTAAALSRATTTPIRAGFMPGGGRPGGVHHAGWSHRDDHCAAAQDQ